MSIEALKTCYTPGWFIETFGGEIQRRKFKRTRDHRLGLPCLFTSGSQKRLIMFHKDTFVSMNL